MSKFLLEAASAFAFGDTEFAAGQVLGELDTELSPALLLDFLHGGRAAVVDPSQREPIAASKPSPVVTEEVTTAPVSPITVAADEPVVTEAQAGEPATVAPVAESIVTDEATSAVADPPAATETAAQSPSAAADAAAATEATGTASEAMPSLGAGLGESLGATLDQTTADQPATDQPAETTGKKKKGAS